MYFIVKFKENTEPAEALDSIVASCIVSAIPEVLQSQNFQLIYLENFNKVVHYENKDWVIVSQFAHKTINYNVLFKPDVTSGIAAELKLVFCSSYVQDPQLLEYEKKIAESIAKKIKQVLPNVDKVNITYKTLGDQYTKFRTI